MSFMAGFGPAFSQSFSTQMARRAQEKSDLFRFTLQNLVDQRDNMMKLKAEDKKAAEKAAALMDGSSAPPEAFDTIYDWVKAGLSDAEVVARLQTGKWESPTAVEGPAEVSDAASAPAPEAQQMVDSGLSAPAPMAPAAAPPQSAIPSSPASEKGGLLSGLFGMKRRDPHDQAFEKAAQAMGMSVEEAKQMASGSYSDTNRRGGKPAIFVPGSPEEKADPLGNLDQAMIALDNAKALGDPKKIEIAERRVRSLRAARLMEAEMKALENGVQLRGTAVTLWNGGQYLGNARVLSRNPDGTLTVHDGSGTQTVPEEMVLPVTEDQTKMMKDINNSLDKPLTEVRDKAQNMKSAMRTYGNLADIVERTNGDVLQDTTSGFFNWAENWIAESATFAKQVEQLAMSGKEIPEDALSKLLADQKKLLERGTNDLGTQKALFDTNKAILVFHLAAAKGQSGRAMSDQDRKIFERIATVGTDVNKFHQAMADVVLPAIRDIDDLGESVYTSNQDIKTFESLHGYIPPQYEYNSLEEDFEVTTDADIQKVWNIVKEMDRRGVSTQRPIPELEEQIPGETPPKIPSNEHIELLQKNPHLAQMFDEVYGAGASAKYLQGGVNGGQPE